jgi:hypothetical protein
MIEKPVSLLGKRLDFKQNDTASADEFLAVA